MLEMQGIISVGNKVDMERLIHGELEIDESKRRVLSCRIMDMPKRNIIRISMPFYEGRMVPLEIGDQYMMNIYADKGIYGSRFTVISRMKDGNIFMADMEIQDTLKKIQRREYFRHNCRIPAQYHMIIPEELDTFDPGNMTETDWKKGILLDISGGGVRMVSEFHEDISCPIVLSFQIDVSGNIESLLLYGRLLASYQTANNRILFEQRVEFEHIDDKTREKIIKFIFDEERKKISKEKGF
ncbi:MAG: flagellar brake domain-containing protein [Lachnospiraceae bacterium]|nr:flagellar brake domain-containing protein [Lachnospiraceae bacterium]